MIVLEGVDGSGKSSLAARLTEDLQLPLHARASDSTKGPVERLWSWAWNDVITWAKQPLAIYDRHPLVSEYIYGPITRGHIDSSFVDVEGFSLSRIFRENSIIIFCDPGLENVARNVTKNPQMSGVTEHIHTLYWQYRTFFHHWAGCQVKWNYADTDVEVHYTRLLMNLNFWRSSHG